ncbi:MAG: tRNA pseudouridine(55) synthase TruB [Clostridia bacterium]|nr:tRNA pseudouridine(55) synthase TruB [Clostridia bacterium]
MDGVINILKPPGITSAQTVAYLKRKLKVKKIGHTGTLDPEAAGVLPVCIGKATKIVDYIMSEKKEYRVEIHFGIKTSTQDVYGDIIQKKDVNICKIQVEKVLEKFIGEIEQVPPMYSAIRHKGKRLYQLARDGIEVKRLPRKVKIDSIKIFKAIGDTTYLFDVICSKGTYMRTLCDDIGEQLGCGAAMGFLLRTKTGFFKLENAYTLEEVVDSSISERLNEIIVPIDKAINNIGRIQLNEECLNKVINGNKVEYRNILEIDNGQSSDNYSYYRIYIDDKFMGIGYIKEYNDKKFVCIKKLLV